jgi:hypothetical protein
MPLPHRELSLSSSAIAAENRPFIKIKASAEGQLMGPFN